MGQRIQVNVDETFVPYHFLCRERTENRQRDHALALQALLIVWLVDFSGVRRPLVEFVHRATVATHVISSSGVVLNCIEHSLPSPSILAIAIPVDWWFSVRKVNKYFAPINHRCEFSHWFDNEWSRNLWRTMVYLCIVQTIFQKLQQNINGCNVMALKFPNTTRTRCGCWLCLAIRMVWND